MSTVCKLVRELKCHNSDVNCVDFSSDTLVSASADKTVRLWATSDFSEKSFSPLCNHTYSVNGCVFSSDGKKLATCSRDGRCIIWDAKTGSKIGMVIHSGQIGIRVVKFSKDGQYIVTGADDEKICIWEVSTCKLLRTLEGHYASVVACAFSPDGTFLVSGSTNGDLKVWDAKYGHGKHLAAQPAAHDMGVTCADFSPTYGSAGADDYVSQVHFLLATGGYDNNIRLWEILAYAGSTNLQFTQRSVLTGHGGPVLWCCFNFNGKLLASASNDKTVRLWNPLKGEVVHVVDAHNRYVTCCAFSPDGRYMASGSNDRVLRVWEILSEDLLYGDASLDEVALYPSAPGVPTTQWSVDEVCAWLTEQGLQQYESAFRQNAIDGTELMALTPTSMETALGITALGHRNKLHRAIQTLKPQHSKTPDKGVPDEYLCPITLSVMKDPVIASDGYTYERRAIEAWIKSGKTNSPMTNAPLPNKELTPNRSLKMLINR